MQQAWILWQIKMAAKLKKRALADYHSSKTEVQDEEAIVSDPGSVNKLQG